ncbi:BirA family transcriptional regulator, biotin operon repressor [Thermodesulfovibrio aggregans]|uniref:biotin--[biotin carboxyl-carrier protein] ligase n=1 Tax=Thermodesulfovibrio aggregans TaxID=86166 RepID=A0A0U9HRX2_9BACT|nr:biotin--[acetyl-CoA-carboxylase] ligase [Thermodesulfovibrio aggregans]GAQ95572.1 BirA family transcriptional regulator, biotin operon repressor [Thermodesulfovibrio aggregans]
MEIKAEDLKKSLPSGLEIGREIVVYDEVESTNSKANELLKQGYPSGTVVIADRQTKGKGRLGRTWISPPGKNLYMSIALKPTIPPKYATLLTLTSVVACTTALRRYTDIPVVIKWPNDMLIDDKKVGGILTELKIEGEKIKAAVVGIGINVNMTEEDMPEEIKEIASSLKIYRKEDLSRGLLAVEIIKEFDKWYQLLEKRQRKTIIDRWMQLSGTIGRQVKIIFTDREILATAEAIDEEGRLIVKLNDGTYEKISAGDVTLLRAK